MTNGLTKSIEMRPTKCKMKTSKLKKIILNKTHSHNYNITIRKMKLEFCFGVACTSFQSSVTLTLGIVYVQAYIHAIDVNIIM
jgi:hypothetical protein